MNHEATEAKEKVEAAYPKYYESKDGQIWSHHPIVLHGSPKWLGANVIDAASRLPAREEEGEKPNERFGSLSRFAKDLRTQVENLPLSRVSVEDFEKSNVPLPTASYTYQVLYEKRAKELAGLIQSGHAPSIDKVARLLAKENAGR